MSKRVLLSTFMTTAVKHVLLFIYSFSLWLSRRIKNKETHLRWLKVWPKGGIRFSSRIFQFQRVLRVHTKIYISYDRWSDYTEMVLILYCNCEHILLSASLSQQWFVMLLHPQLQHLTQAIKWVLSKWTGERRYGHAELNGWASLNVQNTDVTSTNDYRADNESEYQCPGGLNECITVNVCEMYVCPGLFQ